MKNYLLIFASCLFFLACQPEGRIYVEHEKLSPDVEWLKVDKREFKVPIEDNAIPYNLLLSFRYANGYQYQVARVTVTEISPSGKEVVTNHELLVRDEKGVYLGEAGYDIWDSEHLIMANKVFEEKGSYTYILEHNMPNDPLNFAMEIGVIVDKIK